MVDERASARDHASSARGLRVIARGPGRMGLLFFGLRARDSSLKMYGTNESHGPNHGPWTPPPAPQPLPPQAQHQNHPRPHPHNHPPSHPPYVPPAYQHPHHHLPPQVIIDGYIPHIRLLRGRGSKIRAKSETTWHREKAYEGAFAACIKYSMTLMRRANVINITKLKKKHLKNI